MDDIEEMPLADVTYEKGQEVLTTRSGRGTNVNTYGGTGYSEGQSLIITRVNSQSLRVRRADGEGHVFSIQKSSVKPMGEDYRRLGEVPEGAISPDHPGIAWLWEDAARLATMQGQCSTYDKICDQLGIPGRERNFEVKHTLPSGIEIKASIRARSKVLAKEQLLANLGVSQVT